MRERRHRRVQEYIEYIREAEFEEITTQVAELLERDRLITSENNDIVLCHNDFHPDNLLYRGADICGVIDFDHAYAGYAHRDVVKAATKFWTHHRSADWDVWETFYDGYRTVTDLGSSFQADEPRYRIETLVVYLGGNVRDGRFSEDRRDIYTERLQGAIEWVTRL